MMKLEFAFSRRGWKLGRVCSRGSREEGAALVETAVSMSIFLMVLFGMIEVCLALYTYSFVSNAARLASRYAAVRGANSCSITQNQIPPATFPNCDMGPTSASYQHTGTDLQTYMRNIGYPGMNPNNLTVTATWLSPTTDSSGNATWITCTSTSTSTPCNSDGNAVQVVVNYQFPLNIPFWQNATLNVGSTSQMVINE